MAINKVIYGGNVLIDLTGDTVTADKLLAGATAHGNDGEQITGACEYDSDTSDATATAAEIIINRTVYARGTKIIGAMPNNGSVNGNISEADESYRIPQGYHDGGGKVQIASDEQAKLVPGNIKAGLTILGVSGTYTGEVISAQSKNITPSVSPQSVLPDDEYDYLSQVTVAAIPYSESSNSAGGITVIIG